MNCPSQSITHLDKIPAPQDCYLKVSVCAKRLNISPNCLRNWIIDGYIPAISPYWARMTLLYWPAVVKALEESNRNQDTEVEPVGRFT